MPRLPTGKIRCHWCKEILEETEAVITEIINKNGISHLKGHKKCVEEAEKRYKIEKKLCEIFDITYCTPIIKKHLNELHKDYSYDVIIETLKLSEIAMYQNLDKGWLYHRAILLNNIPEAVKKVKQKELTKRKIEEKKQENKEEIVIQINKKKETSKQSKFDIANL